MLADFITEFLADGPRTFWESQDASGNPVDSSGNSLDMTSVTGTLDYHQTGPSDAYAIKYDASEYATRATVSTVTNNLTMAAWYYHVSGGQDRILWNGNLGANGWAIYSENATGKIFVLLGGVAQLVNSNTVLSDNTWYYVVAVRESGTWKYYINGVLDGATPGSTAPSAPSGGTSGLGSIDGAQVKRIGPAGIFETALSASRILTHYQSMFNATVDSATVYFDLNASGTDVLETNVDTATVPITLTPSAVELYEPVDANTVSVDLQASGTDQLVKLDAATVYLDLTVDGGECYSTASIQVEGEAFLRWFADANARWSADASERWTASARRGGGHC